MSFESPRREPGPPPGPPLPLPQESASVGSPPPPPPDCGPPPDPWSSPRLVRPTSGLALAVAVLSGLYVVVTLVMALLAFPADAEFRSAGEEAPTYLLYSLLALPQILVMFAAYVVTNVWLMRARENGDLITPHFRHRRSPAWIWLGWLIPVVSFWFPRQVVDDIHRASQGIRDNGHHVATRRINVWWATWIASLLIDYQLTRRSFDASAAESGLTPGLELASAVALAVACVPWLLVVRGLTRIQEAATT